MTKGEWVVRNVHSVDTAARRIWFVANGRDAGQDPYFLKYHRINFDGTGLVSYTPEDGTHTVTWSPDTTYYVDQWQRPDLPTVTVLKRTSDQSVVMELERRVGMLSFHELRRALAARSGALGEVKVAEIMQKNPVTATPEMEVNDLRRTMIDSGARYLPVMQDGKLLGVISFRDVAKAVLEEQDFENKMLKGYIKNWPA